SSEYSHQLHTFLLEAQPLVEAPPALVGKPCVQHHPRIPLGIGPLLTRSYERLSHSSSLHRRVNRKFADVRLRHTGEMVISRNAGKSQVLSARILGDKHHCLAAVSGNAACDPLPR